MTQEEKQLLLITLCGMLPYGVNMHIKYYDLQDDGELASRDVKLTPGNICYCFDNGHWVSVKPYLRPMSSMTEEEKKEYDKFYFIAPGQHLAVFRKNCERRTEWLNKHHFDYRGLIEKGLALEAPKDMYK